LATAPGVLVFFPRLGKGDVWLFVIARRHLADEAIYLTLTRTLKMIILHQGFWYLTTAAEGEMSQTLVYGGGLVMSRPPMIEFVKTGRIRGTIFTFLFTLAGYVMYGTEGLEWTVALLTAMSCSLLHMSIMTFNDWHDRAHDLKKGKRLAYDHPQTFFGYWAALTAVTLGVIALLAIMAPWVATFCAMVLATGLLYSYLEHIIVLNNLIVAVCGASPVLCGSVYLKTVDTKIWIWYSVFFFLVLGREMVKDIEDSKIDQGYKNTLATKFGVENAKRISIACDMVAGFFIFLTQKAHELLALLGVLVYKFVRWDPTSNPRRLVILHDTLIGLLVIFMVVPLKYGNRENAMLDMWSVEHLLWGVVAMASLKLVMPKASVAKLLALTLCVAYAWEAIEYSMELGVLGSGISQWKRGFENWSNRLIGDPLLVLLGGYVQVKWSKAWKWVVIPWAVWGIVNYLSPDSMFIQEAILKMLN